MAPYKYYLKNFRDSGAGVANGQKLVGLYRYKIVISSIHAVCSIKGLSEPSIGLLQIK